MLHSTSTLKRSYAAFYNFYKKSIHVHFSRLQSIEFPERFKGTIVERWKDYWVNLSRDYADVAKDTVTSAKSEPRKTATILSVFGFGYFGFATNPDESSYRDRVLSYKNEIIFIGPSIRNPTANKYLEEIENYFNEGLLKRLSFGFFSIIWKDDYNVNLDIYKSQCTYLKEPFYNFHKQIVDIGFMNRWFIIERQMNDFDINPEEWAPRNGA